MQRLYISKSMLGSSRLNLCRNILMSQSWIEDRFFSAHLPVSNKF